MSITITQSSSSDEFIMFLRNRYQRDRFFWNPFIETVFEKCRQYPIMGGKRKRKKRSLKGGTKKEEYITFKAFLQSIPIILFFMGTVYISQTVEMDEATLTILSLCEKFRQTPIPFIQGILTTSLSAVSSSLMLTNTSILKKLESAFSGKDPFAFSSLIGLSEKIIKCTNEIVELIRLKKPPNEKVNNVIDDVVAQTNTTTSSVDMNMNTFQQIVFPENSILLIPKGTTMKPFNGGRRQKTRKRRF